MSNIKVVLTNIVDVRQSNTNVRRENCRESLFKRYLDSESSSKKMAKHATDCCQYEHEYFADFDDCSQLSPPFFSENKSPVEVFAKNKDIGLEGNSTLAKRLQFYCNNFSGQCNVGIINESDHLIERQRDALEINSYDSRVHNLYNIKQLSSLSHDGMDIDLYGYINMVKDNLPLKNHYHYIDGNIDGENLVTYLKNNFEDEKKENDFEFYQQFLSQKSSYRLDFCERNIIGWYRRDHADDLKLMSTNVTVNGDEFFEFYLMSNFANGMLDQRFIRQKYTENTGGVMDVIQKDRNTHTLPYAPTKPALTLRDGVNILSKGAKDSKPYSLFFQKVKNYNKSTFASSFSYSFNNPLANSKKFKPIEAESFKVVKGLDGDTVYIRNYVASVQDILKSLKSMREMSSANKITKVMFNGVDISHFASDRLRSHKDK